VQNWSNGVSTSGHVTSRCRARGEHMSGHTYILDARCQGSELHILARDRSRPSSLSMHYDGHLSRNYDVATKISGMHRCGGGNGECSKLER
jgi:hypothetical protein